MAVLIIIKFFFLGGGGGGVGWEGRGGVDEGFIVNPKPIPEGVLLLLFELTTIMQTCYDRIS